MTIAWRSLWERVQTSYWFVPSIMMLLAVVLAAGSLLADRLWSWEDSLVPFVYGGSSDGARELLSTLAGATITVAGVMFSVTIVVLSLASQQFGPRLLRSFMADRSSQVVLGSFISAFLFHLLVLSQVYEYEDLWSTAVPRISVTLALLIAMADFAMLVYFVHHMASMVRVETILGRVAGQFNAEIDRLFPQPLGEDPEPQEVVGAAMPVDFQEKARAIHCRKAGYIDTIDAERLMGLAQRHDLLIRLHYRPGEYLLEGTIFAQAYPDDRADDALADVLRDCLVLGQLRTPTQDVEFPIYQLVEVACRALSPSMNDPFTAITCIDHLGTGMAKLLDRKLPSPLRYDSAGRLRVIAKTATLRSAMDAAFNMIRQSAHDSIAVSVRLLDLLRLLAGRARRRDDYHAVLTHARKVQHEILATDMVEADRDDIRHRYHLIVKNIKPE